MWSYGNFITYVHALYSRREQRISVQNQQKTHCRVCFTDTLMGIVFNYTLSIIFITMRAWNISMPWSKISLCHFCLVSLQVSGVGRWIYNWNIERSESLFGTLPLKSTGSPQRLHRFSAAVPSLKCQWCRR